MYHPDQGLGDNDAERASGELRERRSCLVGGCPCKDPRNVSHRRAAFFAAIARRTGETADRVIAVEAGWRPPTPAYA